MRIFDNGTRNHQTFYPGLAKLPLFRNRNRNVFIARNFSVIRLHRIPLLVLIKFIVWTHKTTSSKSITLSLYDIDRSLMHTYKECRMRERRRVDAILLQ